MCGIAGYVSRAGVSAAVTEAMIRRLAHRGPDASAIALFASANGATWRSFDGTPPPEHVDIALGHRRLSIIDLSERGRQPMTNATGDAWIVFNGEIYNYLELRAELSARGHVFQTATDTEVVLAGYREWGHAALSRFNGMFAFAIWDKRTRELWCARDRLGVKPLYYWASGEHFVFGSEIKALLEHPRVPRRPNPAIIYDYLAFKQCDHTDETFYAEIKRLPAAHHLVVRPNGQHIIARWWDVTINDDVAQTSADEARMLERFGELFRDAIRLRLRSDVPIGTCLSGGLDSSAIAITANELIFREHAVDRSVIGEHQKTFSACFKDARFDEREFVQLVLDRTGADSYKVFPEGDGFWADVDKLLSHMDEPFHSTSQYSQFCVMRRVGEVGVKVTLDGQGADELLAGYPAYHSALLSTLIARGELSRALREAYATIELGGRGRTAGELASRIAYGLLPLGPQLRRWISPLARLAPERKVAAVVRPELEARFTHRRLARLAQQSAQLRDFPRRLYNDVFHDSLPALLRYEDRNSMAFSIEARTPFLDYRLVEHVFAMPMEQKIRGGWTKRALRDAMVGLLPEQIQWREDKKGFVTPEAIWLRAGRERVLDTFGGALASHEFLDRSAVSLVVKRELDSVSDGSYYTDVFRWLLLELWMRNAFR